MARNASALALYRALLRQAAKMPTPERRRFVQQRARLGFEEGRSLSKDEDIQFHMTVAETQLDNVTAQQELLNALKASGNLKS